MLACWWHSIIMKTHTYILYPYYTLDALYNSAELKTCFCHAWSDIYKCVNILCTTVHVLCVYACVCCVSKCVCMCVWVWWCAKRCVWWNLHHTNSERLKYGLCQTWSVLPPIRELLYIRATEVKQLVGMMSRPRTPSKITLLVITPTRMVLKQTIHGPTLQQTRSD